jgi:hypothetical protein
MRILKALALAAALCGCLGGPSVEVPPVREAAAAPTSRSFSASYETIKAAALASARRIDVEIVSADEMGGIDEASARYRIRFEKGVGALSRGVMGEIDVFRIDGATTGVVLTLYERGRNQLTVTSDRRFADQLFGYIAVTAEAGNRPMGGSAQ